MTFFDTRDELTLLAALFGVLIVSLAFESARRAKRAAEGALRDASGQHERLEREVADRHRADEEVRRLNDELERRVAARTAELEAAVEALRRSEERFDLAADGSNDGIWDWDVATDAVHYSPRYKELLGYAGDEFPDALGAWESRLHPDEREAVFAAVREHFETGARYDREYRLLTKAGDYRWFRARGRAVRDPAGRPVRMVGSMTDVTGRRAAEAAVRASEERFRRTVIGAALPMLVHADDGEILAVSDGLVRLSGYRREELATVSDWASRAYAGREAEVAATVGERMRAGGPVSGLALDVRRADGALRKWEWHVAPPEALPDGRRMFVAIAADLTDRDLAEEALRVSEERFRNCFNHSSVGMTVLDPAARFLRVNAAFEAMLGRGEGDLIGRTAREVTHPDDLSASDARFGRLVAGEAPSFQIEKRYVRRDGADVWAITTVTAVRDPFGDTVELVAQVQDITERKRAEEAVRRSEERFRVLFDCSSDAHLLFDETGIIDCNAAAIAMLRCRDKRAVLNLHPAELSPEFQPDGRRSLEKCVEMDATARERGFHRFEWVHLRMDGETFPAEVTLNPVVLAGKSALLVVWHDITDRKRHEDALRDAKEAAEAASRAKSEFLANMSHEIRTPMNGVLGMLELSLAGGLSAGQRELVGTARRSAESLLEILNDLLDFSKIEAGRMELDESPFAVRDLVEESVRLFAARSAEKGLALSCSVAAGVPSAVVGDAGRVRQILVNLVGNAVKFTAAGGVRVAVSSGPAHGGFHRVRFEVVDTGIGVPAAKQAEIFEAFTQADTSVSRRFGGTGLGLSISNSLSRLMGGGIEVESEPGRGSTFRFVAPFRAASCAREAAAAPSVLPARPRGGLDVLLAEDNPVNRAFATRVLQGHGHRVTCAADGREAVAAAAEKAFDVILMDVQMPEMDGIEATARIRAAESAGGRRTPIVAMTAHALREDRDRCLAAGMDDYVSKPVAAAELARKAEEHGFRHATPAGPPAAGDGPAGRIDREAALRNVGDEELFRELAALCLDDTPKQLAAMRDAAARGHCDDLRRAAHTLKGAAGIVGAAGVVEAAYELERTAARASPGEIEPLLREIEARYAGVLPELKELAGR